MLETSLKAVITAYRNLSFCDRTAFYYSVSNDVDVSESNLQVFLFKTRLKEGSCCIYCEGEHIVKNGHRKDGTQRYICRDCKRSFIPTSFFDHIRDTEKTGRVGRIYQVYDGHKDLKGDLGRMRHFGNHGLCVAAQNTRRPSRTDRQGVPCRNR